MQIDRKFIQRASLIGLGAVFVTILIRRLLAPKIEQDQGLATSQPVGGVTLLTTDYTPAQAAAFKAALPERAQKYADLFVEAGRKYGVPPLALAGIMFTETRFGEACKDAACQGFTKHDWGLMQINDEAHPEFFTRKAPSGIPAYQDPRESIMYAAQVLRDTSRFFDKRNSSGKYEVSVGRAAKYGCTPGKHPDPRPLTGEMRLVAGIAGYNAGQGNAIQALACGLSADAATHGQKYVKTALGKAKEILARMGEGVA